MSRRTSQMPSLALLLALLGPGSALADPGTVLGHRWCAGEYLLSPVNRTDTFVHRPRFDVWPNDLGLERAPISDRAYAVTLDAYQLVEQSEIERPASYLFGRRLAHAATVVANVLGKKLAPPRRGQAHLRSPSILLPPAEEHNR